MTWLYKCMEWGRKGGAYAFITLADYSGTNGSIGGVSLSGSGAFNGNLADFFNLLFRSAIVIGAILAVLRLAYAGWMYMGSDVWSSKQRAKDAIWGVVLGLLLLLSVWLILKQINPEILNLNVLRAAGN